MLRRGAGPGHGDKGRSVRRRIEIAEEKGVFSCPGQRHGADALADSQALGGPHEEIGLALASGLDRRQQLLPRRVSRISAGRPAGDADGNNDGVGARWGA